MIERLLAGEAALAADELGVAERLFQQVADADPRNAIALAGLARVALGRDDLDRARTLAGQALALDPGEAAARRLIAELDRRSIPALAPEPAPALEATAAGAPEPVAAGRPHPPAPTPRGGWRGWLARLLRRT